MPVEIPKPEYFYLRCPTCSENLKCLLATTREELLYPDWDDKEAEREAGPSNFESLRCFHDKHRAHFLEAVECPIP
jgi:hypothetical protein